MPINAQACRSLPINQPVDSAKDDTPIAHACALGGSTKLSAGGFVLVSVEATGSPELMKEAMRRLERRWEDRT
jgi:hypothetical protein